MKRILSRLWLGLALTVGATGCHKAPTTASTPAAKPVSIPDASKSAATAGPASSKVKLAVQWPLGSRYTYRMDMEQHSLHKIPQMPKPMEQDVTMGLTYAINPVKARSDGGRVLELEFIAQDMEVKMGGNVMVNFDSKEIGSQGQLNPMMASFRKMIGSKLRFETDSAGKVERFVNLEEWKQSILGTGERPENFMFNQTYNEGYFRQLVDFAVGLPAQPIELGDTWPVTIELPAGMIGKIGVKLQNTFKGREDREQHACVAISFVGTLASAGGETTGPMGKLTVEDGQLTGTTWFDPKLGAMIETTSKQSMRLRGEFPGEPGVKGAQFTSDVMQTVAGKLVEVGK